MNTKQNIKDIVRGIGMAILIFPTLVALTIQAVRYSKDDSRN